MLVSADGRIILKWILAEIEWEDVDWIHVAEARDQSHDLVNTVTNLRVPQNIGNFLRV
jgi:hypothetical protein